MTRPTNWKEWSSFVFKAIAMAMGIAVIVQQVLGTTTVANSITLLGIGLFSLALSALSDRAS